MIYQFYIIDKHLRQIWGVIDRVKSEDNKELYYRYHVVYPTMNIDGTVFKCQAQRVYEGEFRYCFKFESFRMNGINFDVQEQKEEACCEMENAH